MKPFPQLLSLVQFEFRSRVQMVFLIIPLVCLSYLQFKEETYHGLGGVQPPVVLFLFVMMAAQFFTPQMMSGFGYKAQSFSFLEFLFTRALDRRLCFWAKVISLLLVFLSPLLLWSPFILAKPKLTISLVLSSKPKEAWETAHVYEQVFPDTQVVLNKKGDAPDKLILPHGRMILLGWSLAWSLFLCLTSLWLVFLFSKFKHGRWFLWVGFAVCIFSPLVLVTLLPSELRILSQRWTDPLIFGFYKHPALWIAALLVYASIVGKVTLREFLNSEVN
jgi:hypothetical protein